MESLVEEEKAQKYASKYFKESFFDDLLHNLETLKQIDRLWKDVDSDSKIEVFIEKLKTDKTLRNQQVEVLPQHPPTPDHTPLFAVHPYQRFVPPKVKTFVDFLVECFGKGYDCLTSNDLEQNVACSKGGSGSSGLIY